MNIQLCSKQLHTCAWALKTHQIFVKPQKLIPKNPAQHAADLVKVLYSNECKAALQGKQIDCIRVDGSVDK